jgi:hypothetical protein
MGAQNLANQTQNQAAGSVRITKKGREDYIESTTTYGAWSQSDIFQLSGFQIKPNELSALVDLRWLMRGF